MDTDHNLIYGCPLCEIFIHPEESICTRIFYTDSENVTESDFIILDCKTCKVPMVVVRDHTEQISKELWGRILYSSRKTFNNPKIKLRCTPRTIKDHFHCHIVYEQEY